MSRESLLLAHARAQADHFSRKFLECKRAEEDLQRRYKDMQRQTEAFTRGTETEISRLAGEKIALAAKYERVKRKAQEYKERLVAHVGDPGEGRKEAPPTTSEAAEPRGPGGEREGEVEGVNKMPAHHPFAVAVLYRARRATRPRLEPLLVMLYRYDCVLRCHPWRRTSPRGPPGHRAARPSPRRPSSSPGS